MKLAKTQSRLSRSTIRALAIFLVIFFAIVSVILLQTVGADSSMAISKANGDLEISLELFTTVPFSPVDIASSGLEDDFRMFVVQQNGVIQVAQPDGSLNAAPFLNITDRVFGGSELGLLGLAFDPFYADNGYFYVNYTHKDGSNPIFTRVSRFEISGDPNVADPTSEFIIFTIEQPYTNHNAGDLNFGQDGYLYFGLGDGGSGGDPENRAQDPLNLLGKMLRIDVSGTTTSTNYLIPEDNPFVDDSGVLDEIWALGFRNPWRFSFDRLSGDMYIGDVGQNIWEEIDYQPVSSSGGENWGWRCYEGNATYNPSGCGSSDQYDFPIHVYNHSDPGCTVIGGYVYRGDLYPDLYGRYLFADYCYGKIWSLEFNGGWQLDLLGTFSSQLTTFGEGINGELFVASKDVNEVYRITLPSESFLPRLFGD